MKGIGLSPSQRVLIEGLGPLQAQMAGIDVLRAQMAGLEPLRAQIAGISAAMESVEGIRGSLAFDALDQLRPQLTGVAMSADVQRTIRNISGSMAASEHLRDAVAGLGAQINKATLAAITEPLRAAGAAASGAAVIDSAEALAGDVEATAASSAARERPSIAAWLALLPLPKQLDLLLKALTVMEAFGLLLESVSKDADIPDPLQGAVAMAMAMAWLLLAVLQADETD